MTDKKVLHICNWHPSEAIKAHITGFDNMAPSEQADVTARLELKDQPARDASGAPILDEAGNQVMQSYLESAHISPSLNEWFTSRGILVTHGICDASSTQEIQNLEARRNIIRKQIHTGLLIRTANELDNANMDASLPTGKEPTITETSNMDNIHQPSESAPQESSMASEIEAMLMNILMRAANKEILPEQAKGETQEAMSKFLQGFPTPSETAPEQAHLIAALAEGMLTAAEKAARRGPQMPEEFQHDIDMVMSKALDAVSPQPTPVEDVELEQVEPTDKSEENVGHRDLVEASKQPLALTAAMARLSSEIAITTDPGKLASLKADLGSLIIQAKLTK